MKWFKFYGQDYLSDPKMLSLNASDRSCWITLLAYSSVNDNGMITHLDEDMLRIQAGISPMHEEWEYTKGILKKLEKLGMIEIDNDMITVINWKKRQETNLTSYERVKRHREKKRLDNAKITLEENRIDKKRKKDEVSNETSPSSLEEITEVRVDKEGVPVEAKVSPRKTEPAIKQINTEFVSLCEKHIGIKPQVQLGKQYGIIKTALKTLNHSEIQDLFDWWFTDSQKGKGDHDLIQITQALSAYNIDRYRLEHEN